MDATYNLTKDEITKKLAECPFSSENICLP